MDAQQTLVDRLATVPLFARCHRADLRVIAKYCEVRDVPADTVLVRSGELTSDFFVLLSGSARRGGPAPPIYDLGPGDYFGELAILDPAPRSLDVMATSDATVGVLTRSAFLLVLDAVTGVAPQLLQALAHRLRTADLGENEPGH